MTDTLRTFADQVTTVAREVGIEGKLGGQANVPGAAGTWRDLTDNVNQLAGNLTSQVRAIAEVSTAVAKGDLTRSITSKRRPYSGSVEGARRRGASDAGGGGGRTSNGASRRASGDGAHVFAVPGDQRDWRVDRDVLSAFGDHDLGEHPLVDRFDLHRRLVGLDLGEHIAGSDGFPFALEPASDLSPLVIVGDNAGIKT